MKNKFVHLISIDDLNEIQHFVSKSNSLTNQPNHLSLSWLSNHQWAAVPMPDSITDRDAKLIEHATLNFGFLDGIAIATEFGNQPLVYNVGLTQKALVALDLEHSLSNFIITTRHLEFAIMKEAGNFFVISGPRDFVSRTVGGSISAARQKFDEYAQDDFWPLNLRSYLISTADRYREFNG